MMKEETNIVELIKAFKYFALITETKQHAIYNDADNIIEGWDTDDEEVYLLSFNNAIEMEEYIADLSVSCGESGGTRTYKILFCQPEKYGEYAERERTELAEYDEMKKEAQ
jgi:hypothetical protein